MLDTVNRYLESKGIRLTTGTIVDGSPDGRPTLLVLLFIMYISDKYEGQSGFLLAMQFTTGQHSAERT